jgi:hypothetical protein
MSFGVSQVIKYCHSISLEFRTQFPSVKSNPGQFRSNFNGDLAIEEQVDSDGVSDTPFNAPLTTPLAIRSQEIDLANFCAQSSIFRNRTSQMPDFFATDRELNYRFSDLR